MDPQIIGLLVLAAVAAGFVDAIAGGGGLITVPVLLMAGLPPDQALLRGVLALPLPVRVLQLADVHVQALVEVLVHGYHALGQRRRLDGCRCRFGLVGAADGVVLALGHAGFDGHALDGCGAFLGEHLVL